jgi:hypothetical protein
MTEMSNIIINTILSENPVCRPNKSLPHAMNLEPMTPPRPAKVKNSPRIVFACSVCVSETVAVMVGKMTDRKQLAVSRKIVNLDDLVCMMGEIITGLIPLSETRPVSCICRTLIQLNS